HQREYEAVQRVVSRFTEIYENTEQYWMRKLEGAALRMERTQEQLERALESADMRVALIPSDTAEEESSVASRGFSRQMSWFYGRSCSWVWAKMRSSSLLD
ncbi:unnamed protein product, partial [Effrenium voratum]